MKPRPRERHGIAVLLFAAIAAATGFLAQTGQDLHVEQIGAATAALRRAQPELYPADPVFGPDDLRRIHPPLSQTLMERIGIANRHQERSVRFGVLAGLIVMLHLCCMYLLVHSQCRSWSISAFVAVLSLAIVTTIGGSATGLGTAESFTPRTLHLAVVPLLVLVLLRFIDRWPALLVFACVGLLGNLHLATTLNLALVLAAVCVARRPASPKAWLLAGGGLLSAGVGALPILWYYFVELRMAVAGPEPGTGYAGAVRALRSANLEGLLYPDILKSLLNWLIIAAVLSLPALGMLFRAERYAGKDLRLWLTYIGAGVVVALVLQGISQAVGKIGDRAPPVIDFSQALDLVMLPLYVLFARSLTNLFRMLRSHQRLLRGACAVVMAAVMLPSDNLLYVRHALYDAATMFMSEADKPIRVQKRHIRRHRREELARIGEWARVQTAVDAVFITECRRFRMLSHRSVVANTDDVRTVYYLTPWRLGTWADHVARQVRMLNPPGGKIDPEDVRLLRQELAQEPVFGKATQWYLILGADVGPAKGDGLLEVVANDGWGKHYMVYRLR